jgi:hypothetical protein
MQAMGPQPATVVSNQPGCAIPCRRMCQRLIAIIRKPTPAACGISWRPAMNAAVKPAAIAPAMVQARVSGKLSVAKARRMVAITA